MRINPGHSRWRTPSTLHGRPPDSVRAATRRWHVLRAQRLPEEAPVECAGEILWDVWDVPRVLRLLSVVRGRCVYCNVFV